MASSGHGGKSMGGKSGNKGQYKTKVPTQCKNPVNGKCLKRKQESSKGR